MTLIVAGVDYLYADSFRLHGDVDTKASKVLRVGGAVFVHSGDSFNGSVIADMVVENNFKHIIPLERALPGDSSTLYAVSDGTMYEIRAFKDTIVVARALEPDARGIRAYAGSGWPHFEALLGHLQNIEAAFVLTAKTSNGVSGPFFKVDLNGDVVEFDGA